jgi:hypothetical protein
MSNLSSTISKWIQLDNQQHKLNEMLKNIKKNKSSIEENVVAYMQQNNLRNNKFQIGNNFISLKPKETSAGLSLKLIKEVLMEQIGNEKHVDFLIEQIQNKKNSDRKISYSLQKETTK